jgi:hypothetical protein
MDKPITTDGNFTLDIISYQFVVAVRADNGDLHPSFLFHNFLAMRHSGDEY